ncbi:MAG: hypothetical protein F7B61_06580 [Caldisphaeraceae archaeon]|nr:hypothetical protein [Caldisphaeraceae archaeon]
MPHEVYIEDDHLVIHIHGLEEFASLHKKLYIPLSHISSVSTENLTWWELEKECPLKLFGSRMIKLMMEGIFSGKRGKCFALIRHPEKCITLQLNSEDYNKIIVEVEDKEKVANEIKKYIAS